MSGFHNTYWHFVLYRFVTFLQVNPQDIVAIKCIEIHSLSPKSKENLLTEIQLMKQLDHKHIVKLKDFNVSECGKISAGRCSVILCTS